jgi:5-hydroxyisourate hydrolase-like protein (transthyretin family)
MYGGCDVNTAPRTGLLGPRGRGCWGPADGAARPRGRGCSAPRTGLLGLADGALRPRTGCFARGRAAEAAVWCNGPMVRHRSAIAIAVCVLLAAVVTVLSANQQSQSITISGRVVADATGQPIRRAWVILHSGETNAIRLGATDLEGGFRFEGLPQGKYRVGGSKRPYLAAAADSNGDDVVLRLTMGAAIFGVVTEGGNPAKEARVVLTGPIFSTTATTNIRGEYRLHGLPAGEYQVTTARALEPRAVTLTTGAVIQALPLELQEANAAEEAAAVPEPAGAASVGGRVLDLQTGQPIAGIRVHLGRSPTTTVTNSSGQFRFNQLRAGTYPLAAQHPEYFARAMATVTLEATSNISDVALRVGRTGSISGTVRDDAGDPVVGMPVRAFRKIVMNLRPTAASGPPVLTDDRGEYRLHGLVPGEYVVCACADKPLAIDPQFLPVMGLTLGNAAKVSSDLEDTVQTFPPTYFPGSTRGTDAQVVKLDQGDDRGGIDITLYGVKPYTISGTVTEQGGPPRSPIQVRLYPDGGLSGAMFISESEPVVTAPDGTFKLDGIAPGRYILGASAAAADNSSSATTPIVLDDRDLTDVSLVLADRPSVKGRIEFSGRSTPPDAAALAKATISLLPMDMFSWHQLLAAATTGSIGTSATPDANGRFVIANVNPGQYNVSVRLPGSSWRTVERLSTGSGDVSLDGLLTVGANGTDELLVTVSDTPMAVVEGEGAIDRYETPGSVRVVAFPADKSLWPDALRYPGRFSFVFLNPNRTFRFEALPPGEYFFALVSGAGFEMSIDGMEEWSRTAQRVRLRGGETVRIDLRK